MSRPYRYLILDTPADHIGRVTLARPEAANALTTQMAEEIKHVFENHEKYRVIILAGDGKHFSAGADLKERKGMNEADWKEQHHAFRSARDAISACPVPVIAAVHGAAYAGGLELALACDFIYAARGARFALTEATLGIMPGMGGTQNLPRAVGERRAKEILFTGKPFAAEEAFEWGMVNRLCDAEALMDEAIACAGTISSNAPLAIKAIKQAVLSPGQDSELMLYNRLLSTTDRQEGIDAFNEKRKPIFKGE